VYQKNRFRREQGRTGSAVNKGCRATANFNVDHVLGFLQLFADLIQNAAKFSELSLHCREYLPHFIRVPAEWQALEKEDRTQQLSCGCVIDDCKDAGHRLCCIDCGDCEVLSVVLR
jgi:hypothetical protein